MFIKRTDLALEARELWQESAERTTRLMGVKATKSKLEGYPVTRVDILDHRGEEALGKPQGSYFTIDLTTFWQRKADFFERAVRAVGTELKALLPVEGSALVVGLGNPGAKYANTRHNMGFLTVDLLAEQAGVKLNKVKFKSAYNIIPFAGSKCLVMKPQTYMNLSGEAVREAAQFYKIPADHVLVIYDDVSLPVGKLRVRPTGSAGGHNGIKNIIAHLGTDKFPRVKVGVGAPEHDIVDWVIGPFTANERKVIDGVLDRALGAAECIITDGVSAAQNRYNG